MKVGYTPVFDIFFKKIQYNLLKKQGRDILKTKVKPIGGSWEIEMTKCMKSSK